MCTHSGTGGRKKRRVRPHGPFLTRRDEPYRSHDLHPHRRTSGANPAATDATPPPHCSSSRSPEAAVFFVASTHPRDRPDPVPVFLQQPTPSAASPTPSSSSSSARLCQNLLLLLQQLRPPLPKRPPPAGAPAFDLNLPLVYPHHKLKKMVPGGSVNDWICINFSRNVRDSDLKTFCNELAYACQRHGMVFPTHPLLPHLTTGPEDIEKTLRARYKEAINALEPGKQLDLLVVILPDLDDGSIYGNIQRIWVNDLGLLSQCCLAKNVCKRSHFYLESNALKINAKVMKGNGKRGLDDNNHGEPSKRHKADLQGSQVKLNKVSVGYDHNVNDRHVQQLERLSALMSAKCFRLKKTGSKCRVLEKRGRSVGLYMEWEEKEDRYFLWGKTADEDWQIKFEVHGGFKEYAKLDVKHPLLAFSESFDQGTGWKEVKLLLEKSFAHPGSEDNPEDHDYLFSFTRSQELLHFRIFKLLSKVTAGMKNLSIDEVPPSFTLEPMEIHGLSGIEPGLTKYVFLDEERLLFKRKGSVNLVSREVCWDSSSLALIPHFLQLPGATKLFLPSVDLNRQWLGFNTSCKEFFDRYVVSREVEVPGTGPVPPSTVNVCTPMPTAASPTIYEKLSMPMKVFSRGLLVCVQETHKNQACYSDFSEDNIFIKRGRVVIVGVRILQYTPEQAQNNLHTVHKIILKRIPSAVPTDVQKVLDCLARSPIDDLDLIANNFAWMDSERRDKVMGVLQEQFTELSADMQVKVTGQLAGYSIFEDKFARNWLLYAVLIDQLPSSTRTLAGFKAHLVQKAGNLQKYAVHPRDILTDPSKNVILYRGRRYVKCIRNSYVHLPHTAKDKKHAELDEEMVDVIVSSEFAGTCSDVQVYVPRAFKAINDERRGSYGRFAEYFVSVDHIEFDPADKK